MFEEIKEDEKNSIDGGIVFTIPLVVKGIIVVGGLIFTSGAVHGCVSEAAKDK